eukprot:765643-Hanusia_phi.AAC.1
MTLVYLEESDVSRRSTDNAETKKETGRGKMRMHSRSAIAVDIHSSNNYLGAPGTQQAVSYNRRPVGKLLISGNKTGVTTHDLFEFFSRFGTVMDAYVLNNPFSLSKWIGFVAFKEESTALEISDKVSRFGSQMEIKGCPIMLNLWRETERSERSIMQSLSSNVYRERREKMQEEARDVEFKVRDRWTDLQLVKVGAMDAKKFWKRHAGGDDENSPFQRRLIFRQTTLPKFLRGSNISIGMMVKNSSTLLKVYLDPMSSMSKVCKEGCNLVKIWRERTSASAVAAHFLHPSSSGNAPNLEDNLIGNLPGGFEVEQNDGYTKFATAGNDKANTSELTRKDLPIESMKEKIFHLLHRNNILIVVGETGCGKSTQLPKYLLRLTTRGRGRIACTQPRRVATVSLAKRVSQEIHQVTYSAVIMDEAHERSMHTDILFGVLRKIAMKRRDLKVQSFKIIVTSATMDAEKFSSYFWNAPIIEIPGKTFPVTIDYASSLVEDYVERVGKTVADIEVAHASIAGEEGKRRVIIATNIAETSLTVDGIRERRACESMGRSSDSTIQASMLCWSFLKAEQTRSRFKPPSSMCGSEAYNIERQLQAICHKVARGKDPPRTEKNFDVRSATLH